MTLNPFRRWRIRQLQRHLDDHNCKFLTGPPDACPEAWRLWNQLDERDKVIHG